MMEPTVMSMLERLTPSADDAEPDWQDVLERFEALSVRRAASNGHVSSGKRRMGHAVRASASGDRRAWRVRFASSVAAAAVVAALVLATPIGGAIARSLDDISSWVTGHPAKLYQKLQDTPFPASLLPPWLHTKGTATASERNPTFPSIHGWDIVWSFSGTPPGQILYFVADNPHAAAVDFSHARARQDVFHLVPTPWQARYPTMLLRRGTANIEGSKYCNAHPTICGLLSVTRIRNVNIYVLAWFRPPNSTPIPTIRRLTSAAIAFLLTNERDLARTR